MSTRRTLGQNEGMPSRVPPSVHMPELADRFYRAISGRARVEVIRFLLAQPGSHTRTIADAIQLPIATVRAALAQIEDLGYLTVEAPATERRGTNPQYGINENAYTAGFEAFAAYLGTPRRVR